ncbi:MAG: 50S ribosomal protein L4 [archaeon]
MKAAVYSKSGAKTKDIELPRVFNTEYRPDLIKRAHLAFMSNTYQPKGADPMAGKRNTAENWGKGGGISRVRRIKAGPMRKGRGSKRYRAKFGSFHAAGRAAFSPCNVGGYRAHPPKVAKILTLKINSKEKAYAVRSAIAATAQKDVVSSRGHDIEKLKSLPLVVEDDFSKISKSKDAVLALAALGIIGDVEKSKPKKVRAGRGKMRGRRYRERKGPLFVLASNSPASKALKNLAGSDVATAKSVNIEQLSPGAHGARLVVWTEQAIKEIGERFK